VPLPCFSFVAASVSCCCCCLLELKFAAPFMRSEHVQTWPTTMIVFRALRASSAAPDGPHPQDDPRPSQHSPPD
jgi:hypothetical protein